MGPWNPPAAAPRGPPLTGQSKKWTSLQGQVPSQCWVTADCGERSVHLLNTSTQDKIDKVGKLITLWRGQVLACCRVSCSQNITHSSDSTAKCHLCATNIAGRSAPNLSFKEWDSRLVTAGAPAFTFVWTCGRRFSNPPHPESHWCSGKAYHSHKIKQNQPKSSLFVDHHPLHLRCKRPRKHLWPNEEPPATANWI